MKVTLNVLDKNTLCLEAESVYFSGIIGTVEVVKDNIKTTYKDVVSINIKE